MSIIVGDVKDMDPSALERYAIILADPPWWYADQRKIRKDGKTPTRGIGACHHYTQMTTLELCNLRVGEIAAERCMLFLWATAPLLPDAVQVMHAWQFKFSTIAFTWLKINPSMWRTPRGHLARFLLSLGLPALLDKLAVFGPGFYTGSNVELVLLGRRGKPFRHELGHKVSQVVFAPRGGHSEKPDTVQERIEWMWPHALPRLELFARRPRSGWTVYGFEAAGTEQEGQLGLL